MPPSSPCFSITTTFFNLLHYHYDFFPPPSPLPLRLVSTSFSTTTSQLHILSPMPFLLVQVFYVLSPSSLPHSSSFFTRIDWNSTASSVRSWPYSFSWSGPLNAASECLFVILRNKTSGLKLYS